MSENKDVLNTVKVNATLTFILEHGVPDGDHHKAWFIDQLVQILTGSEYEQFIEDYENGVEGEYVDDPYEWDVGTPP